MQQQSQRQRDWPLHKFIPRMRRNPLRWVLAAVVSWGSMLRVAVAQTEGSGITGPMIDAMEDAGGDILGPLGVLLGVLATIAIGWAILRTIRGG